MTPSTEEPRPLDSMVRALRHPVRVAAMTLSALAVTWGFAPTAGLVAAAMGAALGVATGEVLGRSRVRAWSAVAGVGAVVLFVLLVASLFTDTELVPSTLGTSVAMSFGSFLAYGVTAWALSTALRGAASRWPAARAIELLVVAGSVAARFAAHRDGVIARPLWLSDWAWQRGMDPSDVFLFLGALAGVLLATLLVLERRGGRTLSSLLLLPVLALLAVACLDVVGRPSPAVDDGIGLTDSGSGDDPGHDLPGGSDGPGGGSGEDGGAGGGRREGGERPPPQARDGGGRGEGVDGGVDAGATARDGGGDGSASSGADGGDSGGAAGDDAGQDGGGAAGDDAGRDGAASGGSGDGGAASQGPADGGTPPPDGAVPPPSEPDLNQSNTRPSQSPAPVAVVVLDNDYSPPSEAYYFRQEAWSTLTGTRLMPATAEGVDDDTLDAFPTRETPVEAPPPLHRTVVSARVALLVDHQHPFALETPTLFRPIRNPNSDRFVRAYRFEALAQAIDYEALLPLAAGNPGWSDEVRAMYVEGHPDERFLRLAEEIVSELPAQLQDSAFAKALAIKVYLDRELIYSTAERHADVPDPTADFLFGNRIGYCVHFAHATVFLWRAVGVPSRISTGYMVPEQNRRGGSAILIRAADAHSWPELYLEGVGWVVLDIAAERNLDEGGEALDEELQRMLGDMAREAPPDPEDEIAADEEESGLALPFPLWVLVVAIFALALLGLYTTKAWRRLRPWVASARTMPRVAYRTSLDRLAELGFQRTFGESREQFASRLRSLCPSFETMTALHVAARLGDPAADATQRPEWSIREWRRVSRAVRREISRSTPLWRRLLGLLHPAAFFQAR